jgi:biofilm PGA synthesis N-glycosyltransferase PgaC
VKRLTELVLSRLTNGDMGRPRFWAPRAAPRAPLRSNRISTTEGKRPSGRAGATARVATPSDGDFVHLTAASKAHLANRDPHATIPHRVAMKFALVVVLASLWAGLSVWLSRPWLADLSAVTSPVFALIAITFIAYVPGFMNAFLFATLLLDKRPARVRPASYPDVSVLIAAYNEVDGIGVTLKSMAWQDYRGNVEILVLNDGSDDATASVVRQAIADLTFLPGKTLRLIDFKVNGGKAAALNAGLAAATSDLIVTLDADCWVHPDGLTNIVERLLSDPANTEAVAGAVMVGNAHENFLTRTQEWDYFHGIAAVKRMQSMFHGTLVAQGAFSIYRRASLEAVGGWPECVGEDIVVSWALLKAGGRIGYAEDAIAFTRVPSRLGIFSQQRRRWSRGLIEAFKAHGALLFQPRLSTVFIWWNLCFPPMDLVFTFIFIPGLALALFGIFYIAGPVTLAVLPLAVLWNLFIYRIQRRTFQVEGLTVHRNIGGFLFYAFFYSLLLQPVCVLGYLSELVGLRKTWGTK